MTILFDTSVWIDLFADRYTIQTDMARHLIEEGEQIVVGDLILVEVLQGTRDTQDFDRKLQRLQTFDSIVIAGRPIALQAARYYQQLRTRGITIRKTIDTLIATRCILDGLSLLYGDRDFYPFVEHLGLKSAMDRTIGAPQ